jgi:hypothetical protein
LDDLCDTRDTMAVGAGEQLHDGRIHSYFARRSSHCAGTGPLSEAMTAAIDLQIVIYRRYMYEPCNRMIAHLKKGGKT